MKKKTSDRRDDLIQLHENLLKQNFKIYHDFVKQREILRLEFLGTSTDYKYLKTWLDIAYEDILIPIPKHGNLTQLYQVLLKNNIITEFLEYANDHETVQLKFIETKLKCSDIKTNLDASNENLKSLKLEYRGSCRQSSNTLHLKLVESINDCKRVKESLNAALETILMLNSEHDSLMRRFRVIFEKNMVVEFLEYAKYQEKLQQKFIEKTCPNECFESCQNQDSHEITSLTSKLTEIKEMLNKERLLIEKIDKERDSLDYLSEQLCRLLLKYQRVTASSDMEQQCSMIDEAMLKSTVADKPCQTSKSIVELDSSSISELEIGKKEIDCDDIEKTINEPSAMKEEKTNLSNFVNTEVELSFSDERDHSNFFNSNELSTEAPSNSIGNSDLLHRNEISTLDNHNRESPETTPQISVLEYLDEHSDDCIPDDGEEESMTTSDSDEIAPDIIVDEMQTKNVTNLRCEIFRQSYPNMCELKEHNCIACERLKLFKCNECNQMFSRGDALQFHVSQVHEQVEDYYDCAYCDKRFMNQKASLKFHIFTKHSEKFSKPYECTICSKSFVERYSLNFHMNKNHASIETSGHSKSSESIQKSQAVQTEVLESPDEHSNDQIPDHEEGTISSSNRNEVLLESVANLQIKQLVSNLRCDIFCQEYPHMCELKEHNCIACERLKLFKCSDCGQMFSREDALQSHVSQDHEPIKVHFDCAYCGKTGMKERRNLYAHIFTKHSEHFDKPYKCTICDAAFVAKFLLTTHMYAKHTSVPDSELNCDICGRHCSSRGALNSHKKSVHVGEKKFKCAVCGKLFATKGCLRQHKLAHSTAKPFKCSVCGSGFKCVGQMNRHQKMQHGEYKDYKPHKCPVCGKQFSRSSTLKQHKFSHSTARPFKCSVCGLDFKCSRHMEKHKKRQHSDHPYKCTICEKSFARKDGLKMHVARHSSLKPFKCSTCNKSFKLSWELKKHQEIIHEGKVQPLRYFCAHCDKGFIQKSHVSSHVHTEHFPDEKYPCTTCGKTLNWPGALKKHQMTHMAEKPYKCSICSKSFIQRANRDNHEKRSHAKGVPGRQERCDICQRDFWTKGDLKNHIKYKHERKEIKCKICGKLFATEFALKCHTPVHNPEKLFKCSTCGMSFKYRGNQRAHERKFHENSVPLNLCCAHCDKRFHRRYEIIAHLKTFHSTGITEKRFECSTCGEIFNLFRTKRLHERKVHENEAQFICAYCNKGFLYRKSLLCHIQSQHLPEFRNRFKCTFCEKAFPRNCQLIVHELHHTSKVRYECSMCDKRFFLRRQREIHELRVHEKGARYFCAHCDKHCFQKETIIRHLRTRHSRLYK